jgi:hypothetical protein
MDDTYSVIEYSIDGGHTWHHGRSVESWVVADQGALAGQRAATREYARTEHGDVESVMTRVLDGDDPRGMLNQPRPDRITGDEAVIMTAGKWWDHYGTEDPDDIMSVTQRTAICQALALFREHTGELTAPRPDHVGNQPRPEPHTDRLQGGFKVLSVFEDHSSGGRSRWIYAMHKDGRVMVANSDRTLPVSDDNLRHPHFYPEAERDQARAAFLARCAQYCTPSFKVHD